MRAFINNDEYSGTPEEIAKFMSLREGRNDKENYSVDFEPLTDIIDDSRKLREKLSTNPEYNPYGGVVPSTETGDGLNPITPVFDAPDTGIVLQ